MDNETLQLFVAFGAMVAAFLTGLFKMRTQQVKTESKCELLEDAEFTATNLLNDKLYSIDSKLERILDSLDRMNDKLRDLT